MTHIPDNELVPLRTVLRLLNNDRTLLQQLCNEGFLPLSREHYTREQAELARVAATLVHELEINWAGTEVILRMRTELLDTRAQVAALLDLLRQR